MSDEAFEFERDIEVFLFRLKNEPEAKRRRNAAWQLGRLREDKRIVPALLGAMQDEDEGVRVRVAEALGTQKDPAVIPALLTYLADDAADVRRQAIESLAYQRDARVGTALLPLLQDENVLVRTAAADAVGKLKTEASVAPLMQLFLADENRDVQHFAAESLKAIGGERVFEQLQTALHSETNPGILQELLEILTALKNPAALPMIESFTEHDDEGVRETAKWAIRTQTKIKKN